MRTLKQSHSAEKFERGDPLVSSSFACYVKKEKKERDSLK